jgi:hypothetical protein
MPGLSFLAPAFLAGLIAVAVPVLLHLYRRRTDRVVEFPPVGMLPEAPVRQQERRRLQDLLLLALRVAALVFLAISFARPYFVQGEAALSGATTIVAIDQSLSMSAPATWAEARRLAREAIDAAPAADLVGLVAFDDRGHLLVPPGPNRGDARAALDALEPGAGGTSFAAGVGASVDALHGVRGRIVVVTDLQQRGWAGSTELSVPDGVSVAVAPAPAAPENLAITALRRGERLTAVVQNFAHGPRKAALQLRLDDKVVARASVDLAPLSAAEVLLDAPLPARGIAEVVVEDPQGFQADNRRFWLLDPARPPTVLVLTAEPPESERTGLYVQRALEAGSDLWPAAVTVTDGRRFAEAAKEAPDVTIVVGTRTLDRRGRERLAAYLREGGRVLLSIGPETDLPTLGDALGVPLRLAPEPVEVGGEPVAIVPSDRRHPIWRQLAGSRSGLGRVTVERYRPLLNAEGWTVLARFAGGAVALAERNVERGRLLVFTSDLDNRWNRFPVDPAFAPFVVESARYLTRDLRPAASYVLPDVPAPVPPRPGAHRVALAPGQTPSTVVVNIDPAESDPASVTAETFASRVQASAPAAGSVMDDDARTREEQQRLWQIGLLVMLGVLAVESVIGRARRTRRSAPEQVG